MDKIDEIIEKLKSKIPLNDEERENLKDQMIKEGLIHVKREMDHMPAQEKLELINKELSDIGVPKMFLFKELPSQNEVNLDKTFIQINIKEVLEDGKHYLETIFDRDVIDILVFVDNILSKTPANFELDCVYLMCLTECEYDDNDFDLPANKCNIIFNDKKTGRQYNLKTAICCWSGEIVIGGIDFILPTNKFFINDINEVFFFRNGDRSDCNYPLSKLSCSVKFNVEEDDIPSIYVEAENVIRFINQTLYKLKRDINDEIRNM